MIRMKFKILVWLEHINAVWKRAHKQHVHICLGFCLYNMSIFASVFAYVHHMLLFRIRE